MRPDRLPVVAICALLLGCQSVTADRPPALRASNAIPAEALEPDDEARQFFATIEAAVKAGKTLPMPSSAPGGALDRAMAPVLTELLERGESVDDWNSTGPDLREVVVMRSGGIEGNMLVEASDFGPTATMYAARLPEGFIPSSYLAVRRLGGTFPGLGLVNHSVGFVSPKVVIHITSRERRVRSATCSDISEMVIYSVPGVSASEMDLLGFFGTVYLFDALRKMTVCAVAREVAPGRFVEKAFDLQGRRLPALDEPPVVLTVEPLAIPFNRPG